jgi:hypothetical protein
MHVVAALRSEKKIEDGWHHEACVFVSVFLLCVIAPTSTMTTIFIFGLSGVPRTISLASP